MERQPSPGAMSSVLRLSNGRTVASSNIPGVLLDLMEKIWLLALATFLSKMGWTFGRLKLLTTIPITQLIPTSRKSSGRAQLKLDVP